VRLELPAVRFVKLRAITTAAFDFAKTAATLALGFIGIFALWMGLMKIAEASGLISIFVMLVQPFLRLLFPEVPKGHPALGMIAMNLAANMLGLGNAATPMGIKAMEQLQTINPKKDTASNPMVMLLAMNTAGVQLLPSATLVAVMGMSSMRVFIPIMIVTGISLIVAIVVTKLLSRLPGFRQASSIQEATEVVK
ncbi:MAG TPA: nucleoside recognition domain-containing protein, partial [Tepidisphaeraceae bacterium]|nr:nucleoside recognition domain-containing protein [Tepidisphaeraceae bacterium]